MPGCVISCTPLAAALTFYATVACGQQRASLDEITLPPGFSIDIYAEGLSNPRSMVLAPNGQYELAYRMQMSVPEMADRTTSSGIRYT